MQIKAPAELALEPNTPDDMEIGAIKYKNGVLQLNANKRITGISQEVWKYQIGGHQVLDKWFKEHKGEALTIDSFTHIENIVGALQILTQRCSILLLCQLLMHILQRIGRMKLISKFNLYLQAVFSTHCLLKRMTTANSFKRTKWLF